MKWQTASLLAFFGSASLASPVKQTVRGDNLDVYTLRISTKTNPSLDGKYLSTSAATNTIGIFHSSTASHFYTVPVSSGNNTVELHAYPAGPVDHALALAAPGGSRLQLDLVNVADPASAGTATGGTDDGQPNTTYDWTSFSLNAEPREAGKPANCLDYDADREGRWVAIPGEEEDEWSVKWQDADGIFPTWNMPIDIVYERVEE